MHTPTKVIIVISVPRDTITTTIIIVIIWYLFNCQCHKQQHAVLFGYLCLLIDIRSAIVNY